MATPGPMLPAPPHAQAMLLQPQQPYPTPGASGTVKPRAPSVASATSDVPQAGPRSGDKGADNGQPRGGLFRPPSSQGASAHRTGSSSGTGSNSGAVGSQVASENVQEPGAKAVRLAKALFERLLRPRRQREGSTPGSQSPSDVGKFVNVVNDLPDAPVGYESQQRFANLRDQCKAYCANYENFETVLRSPADILSAVKRVLGYPPVTKKDGTKHTDGLKKIFKSGHTAFVGQIPTGQVCLMDYIIQTILCSTGGLFIFAAAAGRAGFWTCFFENILPFFVKGGRGIIILPLSELDKGALGHLLAWREAISKAVADTYPKAGLRFVFVTSFDKATFHTKHLMTAAPGGILVNTIMTGNMNTAALGVQAVGLPKGKMRADAVKSFESLNMTLFDTEESITDILRSVARYYGVPGLNGWYCYAVTALEDVVATRAVETPQETEQKALRQLYNQALRIADQEPLAKSKRTRTHWLVGIASMRPDGENGEEVDFDDEDAKADEGDPGSPELLAIEEDDDAADTRSRALGCKKVLSTLHKEARRPRTKLTAEDRAAKRKLDLERIAKLKEANPHVTAAFIEMEKELFHDQPPKRRRRARRNLTQPSESANVVPYKPESDDSDFVSDSSDEDPSQHDPSDAGRPHGPTSAGDENDDVDEDNNDEYRDGTPSQRGSTAKRGQGGGGRSRASGPPSSHVSDSQASSDHGDGDQEEATETQSGTAEPEREAGFLNRKSICHR